MDDGDVGRLVEGAFNEDPLVAQQLLHMLVAALGEVGRPLLLVEIVILALESRQHLVDQVVEIRLVVRGTRDDQRRPRLVDQDGVDFVDDGEGMTALDHMRQFILHVVAQVVEAELVVGAVGDVSGVGAAALVVVDAMHDDASGHAEKFIDGAHPFGVAAGEVIIDGDDVDALAGERIEVGRKRGDEGLATRRCEHLRDAALVQHHAADQLNVEVTLSENAARGFAHGGEGRRKQIVERPAGGEAPRRGRPRSWRTAPRRSASAIRARAR